LHPLCRDLGGITDPQLHFQLRQQPLEPARVSTGFDPYPYPHSAPLQLAIKAFGFACAVLQRLLAILSALLVQPRNLLHARVIITSYNQHVRLLSPEPWKLTLLSLLRSEEPTGSSNQRTQRTAAEDAENWRTVRRDFFPFVGLCVLCGSRFC